MEPKPIDPAVSAFIAEIEQAAAKLRVSMAALCERAKIDTWTVGRWKAGRNSPTMAKMSKLRAALDEFRREAEAA